MGMKSVFLLPLLLLVLALVWSGDGIETSPNAASNLTPVADAAPSAANCIELPVAVVVADGDFDPCAEELQ